MRYGGLPIAMLTLTPRYSAMTPRENRTAPVHSRVTTISDVHPAGTASPVILATTSPTATSPTRSEKATPSALTSRRARVPPVSTMPQKCDARVGEDYPDRRSPSARNSTGAVTGGPADHPSATSRYTPAPAYAATLRPPS